MVPEWSRTARHRGAAEIEAPAETRAVPGHDRLDDARPLVFRRVGNPADQRGDVDLRFRQRIEGATDQRRIERRQVTLQVDHHVVPPVGIDTVEGGAHPVAAGRQVGIGQHRAAARRLDRGNDRRVAGGDHDRSDRPPRPPGARHGRSSAGRRSGPAASRAASSRRGGPVSRRSACSTTPSVSLLPSAPAPGRLAPKAWVPALHRRTVGSRHFHRVVLKPARDPYRSAGVAPVPSIIPPYLRQGLHLCRSRSTR